MLNAPTSVENHPKLVEVFDRQSRLNDDYMGMLSKLEDSLNKILDKRQQGKEIDPKGAESTATDAITALHQQLNRLESYNSRFSQLIYHVQEII